MTDKLDYRTYPHNPPHFFVPDTKYFITAATYKKQPYLKTPAVKEYLIDSLHKACNTYLWKLEDWVVLDNHYHCMLNSPEAPETLGKLINEVHKFSALFIKKIEGFKKDFDSGHVMVSMSIINFLKDWLINHIQVTDKKYSS